MELAAALRLPGRIVGTAVSLVVPAVATDAGPSAVDAGGQATTASEPTGRVTSVEGPDTVAELARAAITLSADVAGLAIAATAGRAVAKLPWAAEIASLPTVVDTQPRLRAAVERVLGKPRADLVITLTSAFAQAATGGRAGLGLDAVVRLAQLAEAGQRRAAWAAARDRLPGSRTVATAAEPVAAERPRPLADGPVERYASRTGLAAAAGAGLALAAGGDPRRATGVALATLPKAAGSGREVFACLVGRLVARRRAVVLDAGVLRRLDRIDTVVLDADALGTGRLAVSEVLVLPDADPGTVEIAAHSVFAAHIAEAAEAATAAATAGPVTEPVALDGWTLGPVERLRLLGRTGASQRRRLRDAGAVAVLGLARGTRLEAVVGVRHEPAPAATALVAAARQAGLNLVKAGDGAVGDAQQRIPGGRRLTAGVRRLQADGHGVLLVSSQRAALGNADCGIGVTGRDGTPPWGAHILVGTDLETAAVLIEAAGAASRVSSRGVLLAKAGLAFGALGASNGRSAVAGSRAMLAVNGAAAISLLYGGWSATRLGRGQPPPPASTTPWHLMPVERVLAALHVGPEGLTWRQAQRRHRTDVTASPPRTGLLRAFVEELANPLTPILVGGAVVSAAVGSVVDAGVIIGVTGFGALLGGVQRTLTDRALAELLARSAVSATVRRDGVPVRLAADELTAGDVVHLEAGDVVPADCRLIDATDLEVDESSLTGESFPVTKSVAPVAASDIAERTSMVYEGTTVAAGCADAVAVATGSATEAGRSMATAMPNGPESGVERRLAEITRTTLPLALGSAGAVLVAGLVHGRPASEVLSAGVGLAVASVPEGLPFLVSAAQLAAARRLSEHGTLVRNARTVEALGRVDVLCFDKTGTLTQGRIRLAAVSDGREHRKIPTDPPGGAGRRAAASEPLGVTLRRVTAAGLRATPQPAAGRPLAHLTDRAVIDSAAELGITRDWERPGWQERSALPFEPTRGFHATLATAAGIHLISVKGAPETVVPRCSRDAGGRPLTAAARRRLHAELAWLTGRGYRVLAVAERAAPQGTGSPGCTGPDATGPDAEGPEDTGPSGTGWPDLSEHDVGELSFLGFLAFADPVRTTAGTSLRHLQTAGAQIVMITGDHPSTAAAIAQELTIVNGNRVVTGAELDALDDDALDAVLPHVAVVARGTPAHKVRVVQAFQRLGRVVAMTGDGANDAPAIRLADVGIALGRRTAPAARAAADLVVTDDRLETIIDALVEGRAMWRSVRQALAVLVGGNLGEIGFTVLGAAISGTSPLNARQLLLVNLLTDLAPAITIALRRPDVSPGSLLVEGPETSLGTALTREVALRAAVTGAGAAGAWTLARATGRGPRARTVALAALVGSQLGQTVLLGGRSPAVLAASLGSAAALVAVIQTPGVSHFFGCTPVGPVGWSIAVGSAAGASLAAVALPWLAPRLAGRTGPPAGLTGPGRT